MPFSSDISSIITRPKLIIIAIIAVLPLFIAYIAQYYLYIEPCRLCVYQRIPYWIMLLTSAAAVLLLQKECTLTIKKLSYAIFLLCILSSIIISFFHIGVENHWFIYNSACTLDISSASTFEQYKMAIQQAEPALCNVKSTAFLGLTMPSYNFIYNIACIILVHFKFQNIKKTP